MAKERSSRSRGPTREEIEREAQREVERLTRRSGAPSSLGGIGGFGGTAQSPLDSVAQSLGGATMRRRPSEEPEPPSFGGPSPYEGEESEYGYEGFDDADDEEEAITEMALRDYAAQVGGRPEDHVVIPVDPASAEAMRDRAMQEFMERQGARQPHTQMASSRKPADGGVLGRLQTKRAQKEAMAAQGLSEPEPGSEAEDGEADDGGVLARIAARRQGPSGPSERGQGPSGPSERGGGRAPERPGEGFAAPGRDDARRAPVYDGPVPEFVNVAARMSRDRPTPAKKAPAKKAPARKAPAKKAPAKKTPAKKAPARKAPAKKAPARKAPAKKTPAKKAPAKKRPS